mgnify:CR=1 FL=1
MARKIKKFKVGIDSETYAISLVESPAIEEQFVALSKEEEKQEVYLEADTKYMVYGAVLVPDKDIYRNDGEKEFYISFTKESIEKMSQDFMKEYRQKEVTLDHEEAANEVTVVESWIKADLFKDKSVALGLNETLPVGTWFAGMKVNNIETWNRIKAGELKGFSVESLISLEEFSKQENNMNINETNDMNFWTKMKEVLSEVFTSTSMSATPEDELVAETNEQKAEMIETEMESEEVVTDVPTVETTTVTDEHGTYEVTEKGDDIENKPIETVEEPKVEEPKVEQPKEDTKHLEDLINSLKEEINALKEMNNGLNDKVKELSKEPSAKPISTNAKPNPSSTYAQWRETMRGLIS